MKKSEVGKRHVRLFSAGAQGVSILFFLHLSYFQPRYHVKILTVTYIVIWKLFYQVPGTGTGPIRTVMTSNEEFRLLGKLQAT
ncbi:hypothetical protein P9597_08840 [Aneurinibacillus migulanus]|uniref:hypothetical protein n=1 Tax=Aneurinibacillus migulanus TaxID=47500 RepID=UPI002E205F93|nr:hypothetical protein [Aneurinibacillus migulanus]